jgi:hypothetical protein
VRTPLDEDDGPPEDLSAIPLATSPDDLTYDPHEETDEIDPDPDAFASGSEARAGGSTPQA